MAIDMPHRAKFGMQPIAGLVQHLMVGRVVPLDPREHVIGAKLAVIDRDAGPGVPTHQADTGNRARLEPRRKRARPHARVEIIRRAAAPGAGSRNRNRRDTPSRYAGNPEPAAVARAPVRAATGRPVSRNPFRCSSASPVRPRYAETATARVTPQWRASSPRCFFIAWLRSREKGEASAEPRRSASTCYR